MRKFFNRVVRTHTSSNLSKIKNPGIVVLLPTIILSGLILVVGLGLSQVLMTELEFSADLLFSEKAYFAAESGVEKSLLALKDKPLNYVVEKDIPVGTGANYDLNIANQVKEFEFDLEPNESVKFRLGYDNNEKFAEYSLEAVKNFNININELEGESTDLQWRILCLVDDNSAKKTIALFRNGTDFTSGSYDDGTAVSTDSFGNPQYTTKQVSKFLSENNLAKNLCFMSLTNFGTEKIRGVFRPTAPSFVAPAKVNVTATGKSFSREKIVSFDYWQKNLSAVYDLGLLYTSSNNSN